MDIERISSRDAAPQALRSGYIGALGIELSGWPAGRNLNSVE
jgi:hypothetical protein